MTPSEQAKSAGLDSLAEMARLINWHKHKAQLFQVVVMGCVAVKKNVLDGNEPQFTQEQAREMYDLLGHISRDKTAGVWQVSVDELKSILDVSVMFYESSKVWQQVIDREDCPPVVREYLRGLDE